MAILNMQSGMIVVYYLQYQMLRLSEQDKLITNMHNMIVYAQKHGILKDHEILINSSDSHNAFKTLSTTCEKHYMEHHGENIKQLLDDEHVMVGAKKYFSLNI